MIVGIIKEVSILKANILIISDMAKRGVDKILSSMV